LSCFQRSEIYVVKPDRTGFGHLGLLSLGWKWGGGGMESSAYDRVRFGMQLVDEKILSRESLTKMTTEIDDCNDYAYGWNIGGHADARYFAKAGGQPGARSYVLIHPDKRVVIVLLCNTSGRGIGQLARDIGELVLADQRE